MSGNVRLRAAREAQGLTSQQDFVAAVIDAARTLGLGELSLSTRTARRWESATPPRPHSHHAQALEKLFGCTLHELGFSPRRPATTGAVTTAAPSPPPPPAASPAEPARPRPLRDTLDDQAVDDYATLTATYRRLYTELPASTLAGAVAENATIGARLLPAATHVQHSRLASAVCDAWLLTARIQLFDSADPTTARASLQQALESARLAGDDARGAAVLAHLALAAASDPGAATLARNNIRMARTFASRAGDPPLLTAWIDAAEADIELGLGDPTRAATLISRAESQHKRLTDSDRLEWLDWLPAHRVTAIKADVLLALGRTSDAVTVLQSSAREAPNARQRAIAFTDLASVAAAQGDITTACALLNEALDALDGRWYDVVGHRIEQTRAQLDPWNGEPALDALDQRLYTWTPALEAAER